MEAVGGKAHAIASSIWPNNRFMDNMDCTLLISHNSSTLAKTTAVFKKNVGEKHFFDVSSDSEGMHSLSITCCNPLVATVLGHEKYRETMCTTTEAEEPILLDVTPPSVPDPYRSEIPTRMLTTAGNCQPVTFNAFYDAGGVDSYSVELVSQLEHKTLAKTTVLSSTCDSKDRFGSCERYYTCVPLANVTRGDQGVVSITAVDHIGLASTANVARYAVDHTAPTLGDILVDDIVAQASSSRTQIAFTAYWRDISAGDTALASVRACGQLQELAPHSNTSKYSAAAFAIQAGRRVQRKLAVVDKYNEKATECVNLPPTSTSHTFQLSLPHGISTNPLSKYALVTQITATSESTKTATAIAHEDIRAFAPFSKNDTLADSWSADIDVTSDIHRVAAHFRSVRARFRVRARFPVSGRSLV